MPLSESTLNEIRAELTGLHQVQVQLNERIKALEAILTPFDFAQVALPFIPTSPVADGTASNGGGQRVHTNPNGFWPPRFHPRTLATRGADACHCGCE